MSKNSNVEPKDYLQFSVDPQENTCIRIAFGAEFKLFSISDGYCGCSLYSKPHEPEEELKLRAKYKKKGWSQDKITRAISDELDNTRSGFHPDLRQQLFRLATDLKSLLLVVHEYVGDIDTETFTIRDKKKTFASDLLNTMSPFQKIL